MEDTNDFASRGVSNPKVIDLISPSTPSKVTLSMLEDRDWLETEAMLSELEEKFNAYLDYVLDGWLVKQYPQYENRSVCIELRTKNPVPPTLAPRLSALTRCSEKFGLSFSCVTDPNVNTSVPTSLPA